MASAAALSAELRDHLPWRRRKRPTAIGHRPIGRLATEAALGAAGLAIGGFALYFFKERVQEEAEHAVIERDGAFSLRRYARLTTAEVTRPGTLTEALDAGFRPLFDYISARRGARQDGASDRAIAMTVPVLARPAETAGNWVIRFVIPRAWRRESLPAPANGVTLGDEAPRTLAALRFSGRATNPDLRERKRAELLDRIAQRGLHAISEPELATYNAPIVPGALRRNEWWVEVAAHDGTL